MENKGEHYHQKCVRHGIGYKISGAPWLMPLARPPSDSTFHTGFCSLPPGHGTIHQSEGLSKKQIIHLSSPQSHGHLLSLLHRWQWPCDMAVTYNASLLAPAFSTFRCRISAPCGVSFVIPPVSSSGSVFSLCLCCAYGQVSPVVWY